MNRSGVVRRVLWWLAIVALIGVAVPVFARATGIETGVLALLVAFMPWVTVACLVPLVLALIARSWVLAGAAVALFALCAYWQAPLFIGGGGGGESNITVASVNMKFGQADADEIVAMVRDNEVDLLSLQELTPEAVVALNAAGLDGELGYSEVLAEPGITGTGLWSRYPLTNVEELQGFVSGQIVATVEAPEGSFTMLAVHPRAPGSRNHIGWEAEMNLLRDELGAIDGPVIVAGDFNTTRDHRVFREIEALGYSNAADRIDAGFHPTFRQGTEMVPLVVIDHVLTRDIPLRPATYSTLVITGADHRAVIVGYTQSGGF